MKVIIFGVPGSGKTHFAYKISEALKIPIFHVYEKAGFEKLEEYISHWAPSHPCLLMHLNMEKLKWIK